MFQDIVRHVARGIAQCPRSAVRKYNGSFRDGQGVSHRPYRHVRQIDQHAEPVELLNYGLAEIREAVAVEVQRGVLVRILDGAGVGPEMINCQSQLWINKMLTQRREARAANYQGVLHRCVRVM